MLMCHSIRRLTWVSDTRIVEQRSMSGLSGGWPSGLSGADGDQTENSSNLIKLPALPSGEWPAEQVIRPLPTLTIGSD